MADRLAEADSDMKDKEEERDELDKLKSEIFSGKYENPSQEFERKKLEMEQRYKPKILIDLNLEENQQREQEFQREKAREMDRLKARERRMAQKERYVKEKSARELSTIDVEPIDSDSSGGNNFSPPPNERRSDSRDGMDVDELSRNSLLSNSNTPTTPNSPTANQNSSGGASGIGMGFSLSLNKRRKIDPKSAFNMDDEGEELNGPAKKKLVPLGKFTYLYCHFSCLKILYYSDYEENAAKQKSKRENEAKQKSEADLARSQEEKRKMHKQIIDKIPIDKEDLFNHPLDRQEIDGTIKKKVQSWINKKIIEYIGEPEPTLVDFICSKLLAGSTPQSILDDVKMVS
jgi:RNA-binding protein 25